METKEASVDGIRSRDFVERVRLNQPRLSSEMKSQYDFIICGSGSSSGSVVAGQPAENPQVSVLLIDVGSEDNVPSVKRARAVVPQSRSERDWNFRTRAPAPSWTY
jgi:choline dehydrogenase